MPTPPLNDFTNPTRTSQPGVAKSPAKITFETIDGINGKNEFLIKGHWLLASGINPNARVGDQVIVSWEGNKPKLILRHSWRRGGTLTVPTTGAVVEELFIATAPATGLVEVWFRNDMQVTNLRLRERMDANPVYVKWGTRSDAFVVATAAHHYYICRISRTQNVALGPRRAVATVVRDEQPLDQNIALVTMQSNFTLTGETKYWSFDWPEPPPLGNPGTLTEAASNAISGSRSENGVIYLTRTLVEISSTNPSGEALITDIHLDDALHLIFVLSLNLNNAGVNSATSVPPIVPATPTPTFNHPVETNDGSGPSHYDTSDDLFSVDVGNFSTHVIVVNVSTGTVLFKTCVDTMTHSVQTNVTRLHTLRSSTTSTLVEDFMTGWAKGGDGDAFFWGNIPTTFDFEYTGLVCGRIDRRRPGVTSYTWADLDATRVPYLDLSNLFLQETGTFVVENGARAGDGSGNFSDIHGIKATFDARWIHQRKRYFLSAVYLPRRATAPNVVPLGLLLVKAELDFRETSAAVVPTVSQGFFLHDLQSGAVTTLVSMAENAYGTSVHIPGGSFFHSNPPETRATFVVLGFNGTHLLWWHGTASGAVTIKLTNVTTMVTSTVLTSTVTANDIADDLQAFLTRNFQVLRPDFFYYPAETPPAPNFAVAWDAEGVPTLDAAATGFPIMDSALRRFGVLKRLPTGVVPVEDLFIARNTGPVNIEDMTQLGPSWHVVQDRGRLGSKLTTDL